MEFWGIEVKSGEPFKFSPDVDMVLHLSQACLGEAKKQKPTDPVHLFLNIDGNKLVLGTLFTEKLPQQQFDLVFDKEFELSHNLKSGSVYFYGYLANNPIDEEFSEEEDSDDSEEEDLPVAAGVPVPKPKQEKPEEAAKTSAAKAKQANAGKQKVKIVEPKKDDEESSDEDVMSEDDDEDGSEGEDGSDDSEDESESDEETPKKAEPSKKRPAESATKTPVQDKKAKVTPQKTDGKKVAGHVATPHPAKQAGKTPATTKSNQKSPKSGAHPCKSCDRAFVSEYALESHSKAKHTAAK